MTPPNQSAESDPCLACLAVNAQEPRYVVNDCQIMQCRVCGLGRSRPRSFDPAAYYTEDYFKGGRDDGYADYEQSAPVLQREFRGIADELATMFPDRTSRLLEVGCAYGFFLREAAAKFEVTGIEIAEVAVEACKQAGLARVYCGTLDSVALDELGQFDIIVMLDVIEHLENPQCDMARLARMLRPGGVIVLSTGDFSAPVARLMQRRWRLMTPPQHLSFFTPKSIAGLARQNGLAVESLKHPWKLVPLALVAYQLKRMLGLQRVALPDMLNNIGIPLNLFDAMRATLRKPR